MKNFFLLSVFLIISISLQNCTKEVGKLVDKSESATTNFSKQQLSQIFIDDNIYVIINYVDGVNRFDKFLVESLFRSNSETGIIKKYEGIDYNLDVWVILEQDLSIIENIIIPLSNVVGYNETSVFEVHYTMAGFENIDIARSLFEDYVAIEYDVITSSDILISSNCCKTTVIANEDEEEDLIEWIEIIFNRSFSN